MLYCKVLIKNWKMLKGAKFQFKPGKVLYESLKNLKKTEICQFCKKPGHKEEKCYRKNKVPQNMNAKLIKI